MAGPVERELALQLARHIFLGAAGPTFSFGPGPSGPPAVGPEATGTPEPVYSPQEARYEDRSDSDQQCSGCAHWEAAGGIMGGPEPMGNNYCRIVWGAQAEGWCAFWVKPLAGGEEANEAPESPQEEAAEREYGEEPQQARL